MVRRQQRQRSLWEVVLPDVEKLWPADLRRIDTLLEDEAVLEPIVTALEGRWAQSRRRGRRGTPADTVLRMLVLKHLYRWSYDTLEHEVPRTERLVVMRESRWRFYQPSRLGCC